MKVESGLLKKYLKQVCMSRYAAVQDCRLNFMPEGIKIITTVAPMLS